MIVLSCPGCGAFHMIFNAPDEVRRDCDDCRAPMEEADSIAEACAVFDRIKAARIAAGKWGN